MINPTESTSNTFLKFIHFSASLLLPFQVTIISCFIFGNRPLTAYFTLRSFTALLKTFIFFRIKLNILTMTYGLYWSCPSNILYWPAFIYHVPPTPAFSKFLGHSNLFLVTVVLCLLLSRTFFSCLIPSHFHISWYSLLKSHFYFPYNTNVNIYHLT